MGQKSSREAAKRRRRPPPPPPPKPCQVAGNEFCRRMRNATGCDDRDGRNFTCPCAEGYIQKYANEFSRCDLDDKCLEHNGGCDPHATCWNRVAQRPVCQCKAPYWEDAGDGSEPGRRCREVDLCGANRGGCDKNANCIARKGESPVCKCFDGFKGGTTPGDVCEDVDECLDVVNPPCGTKEQHATCTNTVGSYTCKCGEGYEGSGYNGDCKLIPYCSDSKLNDCDPVFATCALKDGSYECTCKAGLEGDGIVGSCKVGVGGNQNRYCEILGVPCMEHQECKPFESRPGKFHCVETSGEEEESPPPSEDQEPVSVSSGKSTAVSPQFCKNSGAICTEMQDCVLISEAEGRYACTSRVTSRRLASVSNEPSGSNTPTWVWGVVGVGGFLLLALLGLFIYWLYDRSRRKMGGDVEKAMYSDTVPAYGATAPAPASDAIYPASDAIYPASSAHASGETRPV